ncbi:hypothetical protein V1525DRAFT_415990 [Lipomyces kononenkoae]|uniref:Uncharacterized protein n=1 Tax=Lipomyces kononenkoae TaxID=34357 RepID=A0ACC3TBR1_LIPKO
MIQSQSYGSSTSSVSKDAVTLSSVIALLDAAAEPHGLSSLKRAVENVETSSSASSASSSLEEYTPSLASSVSSVSSVLSLRLSTDSSPVLGPNAQQLKFLPLPTTHQTYANALVQQNVKSVELALDLLSRQSTDATSSRTSSASSSPARPSLVHHRRHSASCGGAHLRSTGSASVLGAKTGPASRVTKSLSFPGPSTSSSAGTSNQIGSISRQHDRRGAFVNSLVDSAALMIEGIWPSARDTPSSDPATQILPLRTFIEETLRRSRTSYSTLQVALYYLHLLRPHVRDHSRLQGSMGALHCGRRAFLTSLILASKYLQDKNYSARAWSKISGLSTTEINANEMSFLIAVDWKIHVPEETYERWSSVLLSSTCIVGQKRQNLVSRSGSFCESSAMRADVVHCDLTTVSERSSDVRCNA